MIVTPACEAADVACSGLACDVAEHPRRGVAGHQYKTLGSEKEGRECRRQDREHQAIEWTGSTPGSTARLASSSGVQIPTSKKSVKETAVPDSLPMPGTVPVGM